MGDDISDVAERLVRDFADVPPITVMQAVCDCAGECEDAGPLFVEQAVRARLSGGPG